jgi:hypothetical protein
MGAGIKLPDLISDSFKGTELFGSNIVLDVFNRELSAIFCLFVVFTRHMRIIFQFGVLSIDCLTQLLS